MFGGNNEDHSRWKQRLRRVFRRTPSDLPTSFGSSSARSTPRVDENGQLAVDGVPPEACHVSAGRQLAIAGGNAEASLIARLGVDPVTGQTSTTLVYKTLVEPDRGTRVPSKQKVRNWLKDVPDDFEVGPIDAEPENWGQLPV
ncbi:hypothetical protein B9G98_00359 [Wickerhamiella sorbophila]|uniref:Uncharacterized protein n=1 Tax=Wickerhamiella sorbophila TaxID=45607 RepID=A0A2T0FCS8_9ASCO|nr:hypothetical protein B9G98_00359 [Wickerhamiella sorbophila]PRT52739.1 hypothetical protein B9G98_00359 [Wickerhamiella sorbophila]